MRVHGTNHGASRHQRRTHRRAENEPPMYPIMWNRGTGAQVMQKIAVPMIGGMVSATLLTLIVIPAISPEV